ncbi:MAG: transketolase [Elusimicrobia bacterium RIFOXYC2_FULL_34_12]|nr:MAG: transketolase [Elusimicrobia bacterium RIFOXYC2_FULL_34_12]OGS39336.1 MAG: transketolase [Elusimicrobia bacterium RIFOXYD2_FULL_34_30]
MVEMKATRYGYGEGLVILGEKNPNVVVIGLDITSSTTANMFKEKFPNRFFSIGIAEQNGMGVAAGLSLVGKIPFVCTYGVFASGRCWDQIRTTICYNNCNVKIGGGHGGISVGPDGATHQALEEITIMRVIPGMNVIVPCDAIETRKATLASVDINGPVYIRFGREAVPVVTDEKTPFVFGKANIVRKGKDVTIIACGSMVYESMVAADELEKENISAEIINIHTIKPIDEETIIKSAKKTGKVVTAEEHQIAGGLGGAVSEVLSEHCPVPIKRVGVMDRFGESGTPKELIGKFCCMSSNVYKAVKEVQKIK